MGHLAQRELEHSWLTELGYFLILCGVPSVVLCFISLISVTSS